MNDDTDEFKFWFRTLKTHLCIKDKKIILNESVFIFQNQFYVTCRY